jgi:hypothetical protein
MRGEMRGDLDTRGSAYDGNRLGQTGPLSRREHLARANAPKPEFFN